MSTPVSKPGRYGTLHRYAVRYGDLDEYGKPGCEIGVWHTWAYDLDGAIDNFYSSDGEFVAFAVCRMTTGPAHRWHWHNIT